MNHERNPFEGSSAARPPARLRARTLAAARAALARGPASRDVWTHIAVSRTARILWAAAMIALAAGHVAISFRGRAVAPRDFVTPSIATGADPEVLELVRMAAIAPPTRLDFDTLPLTPRKENES